MGGLPDVITFRHQGRRAAVVHGGITDIVWFLWPVSADSAFAEEIAALTRQVGPVNLVLLAGHCGLAFCRQVGDVTWINSGAIGMSPHDGWPQTRFADLSVSGAMIHTCRQPLDCVLHRSGPQQVEPMPHRILKPQIPRQIGREHILDPQNRCHRVFA